MNYLVCAQDPDIFRLIVKGWDSPGQDGEKLLEKHQKIVIHDVIEYLIEYVIEKKERFCLKVMCMPQPNLELQI
jgi:hypothetical protein